MSFLFVLSVSAEDSKQSIALGFSPSRGLISYDYFHGVSKVSAGLAFVGLTKESFTGTVLNVALNLGYHPWGFNGFFIESSHQWLGTIGSEPEFAWISTDGTAQSVHYPKVSVWEVLSGIGYQRALWTHFLVFADAGVPFYAGQGGYFLRYNNGQLDKDGVEFQFGGGIGFCF